MGIEAPLMTDEDGNVLEDFYELPNGCICCTVKDDLLITLEKLVEKWSDIELILIESNGLANPAEIIKVFWLDDALESNIKFNYTLCLIDAKNFSSFWTWDDTKEALEN